MNRLKDFFGDPREPDHQDDYFEVDGYSGTYFVSRETATVIERQLDGRPTPRWIVFRDLAGARHRVLAVHISRISESTTAQRQAARDFGRARRLEEKKDRRPWEEDD